MGALENGPFGNLWGGTHERRPEVVKDTPPEAPKGHKEQKDAPSEGPNGDKEQKGSLKRPQRAKGYPLRKAQKARKGHRIPPLKAQNAKIKAPKAK